MTDVITKNIVSVNPPIVIIKYIDDVDTGVWVQKVKKDLVLPICKTILVTPDFAKSVMKNRNFVNRSVNEMRVKKYARDMTNNNWQIGNDDICFYEDGSLANGQHRLKAVIKANKSVLMIFKFGVSPAAAVSLDEGRSRSVQNSLHAQGITDILKRHVSAAGYVLEFMGERYITPRKELEDFTRKHLKAAIFAIQGS